MFSVRNVERPVGKAGLSKIWIPFQQYLLKYITKTVWVLSLISLFTDMASEMLYPVMPVYLKTIGFSMVLIGVLEGFAEAIAGLSKGYFGKLSDNSGKRALFIQMGYGLSAVAKPLIAIFVYPLWVFLARTMDRFGKGIRTGARDALLSDESTPETKGKIFGLHRAMDTLGAVFGPFIALVYLYYFPQNYQTLFFIAFIPGLLAVLTSLLIKDKGELAQPKQTKISLWSFLNYWKTSPVTYRKLVSGLLIFALFNSSDVFLLLKLKESGYNDTIVISIYIFYNLIYALFAFPVGIVADKMGLKATFITGLVLFAIVYLGMAFNNNWYLYWILFFIYGLYAAATEGISKAWISNITDKKDTATAIGTYSGFQSICTLFASSFTGFIWYQFNDKIALLITSIASFWVVIYFLVILKSVKSAKIN